MRPENIPLQMQDSSHDSSLVHPVDAARGGMLRSQLKSEGKTSAITLPLKGASGKCQDIELRVAELHPLKLATEDNSIAPKPSPLAVKFRKKLTLLSVMLYRVAAIINTPCSIAENARVRSKVRKKSLLFLITTAALSYLILGLCGAPILSFDWLLPSTGWVTDQQNNCNNRHYTDILQ